MPEAIIKYAVNSTLGTDEFKPLDIIIKGQRVFAPSHNTIIPVISFSSPQDLINTGGDVDEVLGSFTSNTTGSVRLFTDLYTQNNYEASILIYKNGVQYTTLSTRQSSANDIFVDFAVTKGATYNIKAIAKYDAHPQVSYISIGAHIIDGSLFSYISSV